METKKIIEINGVKMEIDLRDAKIIEHYRVGDSIKVLQKSYGDKYDSHIGTIIGFDDFKKLPTVVIAILKVDYSDAKIEFVHFNEKTEDIEITALNKWDLPIKKSDVIKKFNQELSKKQEEIREIEKKMNVFESLFGKYFQTKEEELS